MVIAHANLIGNRVRSYEWPKNSEIAVHGGTGTKLGISCKKLGPR